jgi:hypothetical protein
VPERGAVWIDAAASRIDLFNDDGSRLAVEAKPLEAAAPMSARRAGE